MSFSFIALIFIIAAAQGVFLALALLMAQRGNHRANSYLAGLCLIFALVLIGYFIEATGLEQRHYYLIVVLWPKEFLIGVLIYFYTRELIQPKQHPLRGKQYAHLALPLLHMLITWPLLLLSDERQKRILKGEYGHGDDTWTFLQGDFEFLLTAGQVIVYIALSLRLLALHSQSIKQNYSDIGQLSLNWLRNLLCGLLVVYGLWLLREFSAGTLASFEQLENLLGLSLVGLIYTMALMGLKQPAIFTRSMAEACAIESSEAETQTPPSNAHQPQTSTEKYRNSPLSDDLGSALFDQLEQHMQAQQAYLDSGLSLPQLAEQLSVSVNYLSQVINEHGQQNFFDYINARRVKHLIALMQLSANKERGLLDLALESGFNSKSSFYSAFKKHQGQTPGQYRKQLFATPVEQG